ncbi:MAG TPA: 2-oxoacid:acceptor oxidoreductase family protein, partial [Terracidiphilus sp.]|nr:2-oxoacid:acceptor oxidoreductase family protein [Terracidiphilus sp.]
VSWLPSYGPEMRSGTSNCHVRIAREPIDSPLVPTPSVLIAMNEPSLRKFAASVEAGGWIIYNGEAMPADLERADVHVLARPFLEVANKLGDARAANMVMLGAVAEISGAVPQPHIDAALRRLVRNPKWIELDERAMAKGRELACGCVAPPA